MSARVAKHTEKLLRQEQAFLRGLEAEGEFPGFAILLPRVRNKIAVLARRNRRAQRALQR